MPGCVFITAAAAFSSVLFQPLFARRAAGGDAAGLRRGLAVLTATCGLAAAVILATHERLVTLVFGAAREEAAPFAALMALGGFARALGSMHVALLSVFGRNRQVLHVSLTLVGSGIAIVLALALLSLAACAAALAARSLGATAWLAWLTRHDLPCLNRAYATEVLLPFGVMLAAAWPTPDAAATALVRIGQWWSFPRNSA